MNHLLAAIGSDPALVFIQGVGNSLPAPDFQSQYYLGQYLQDIALQIGQLGGTPEAFYFNPTAQHGPGYAFAGANFTQPNQSRVQTEVTSAQPGNPPAVLDGMLERDRHWRLTPSIGTPRSSARRDVDALRAQ